MGRLENEFSTRLAPEPAGAGARPWAEAEFKVAEELKCEAQAAVKKMLSYARQRRADLAAVLAEWSRVARCLCHTHDTGTPLAHFTLAVTKEQYVNAKFYY